jgi:hypothetical protein
MLAIKTFSLETKAACERFASAKRRFPAMRYRFTTIT